MEHKIGEVFIHNGRKLRVEQTLKEPCQGCYFFEDGFCVAFEYTDLGGCAGKFREDGNTVVFRLIKED